MPIIAIHPSPGRSVPQRRLLLKRITEAVEDAYNAEPEGIPVLFRNYREGHRGKGGFLHKDGS